MTTAPEVDHTRAALLAAARRSLVEDGHAGTTVHTVARGAGLDAQLVAEHFGDLESLLAELSTAYAQERAEVWQDGLAHCTTLGEVVHTARQLRATERARGSPIILGQSLAGGQHSERIAAAVSANFELHAGMVEATIDRILAGSPLEGVLDPEGLGRTLAAGFIGLELVDSVVDAGTDLFEQLEVLARLVDEVLAAGVVSSAWIRHQLGWAPCSPIP